MVSWFKISIEKGNKETNKERKKTKGQSCTYVTPLALGWE
jgi:hypothetical protein